MITSVELAHYGVSRAKDWASVDCDTFSFALRDTQNVCGKKDTAARL